jgi:hypothetical protein
MMDAEAIKKFRNDFVGIVGAGFPVLYHGTNDLEFGIGIAQKFGFHSTQAFQSMYCRKALGGTAIYGPGIYLTKSLKEVTKYGANVLAFSFSASADYVDLSNPAISKAAVASVGGGGKQSILGEAKLDMLLRVTQDYYVLRTPALVSPSSHS